MLIRSVYVTIILFSVLFNNTKAYCWANVFAFQLDTTLSSDDSLSNTAISNTIYYKDTSMFVAVTPIRFQNGNLLTIIYQVQIDAFRDEKLAEATKQLFISQHPEEKIQLIYDDFLYKIRIGSYKSFSEAKEKQKELKKKYKGAYVVSYEIMSEYESIRLVNNSLGLAVKEHIKYNKKNPFINGYRVQVYSDEDRESALQTRAKLLLQYPDYTIILKYEVPNFKLRVGACKTIWEAKKMQQELLKSLHTVYIVPDIINIKELE